MTYFDYLFNEPLAYLEKACNAVGETMGFVTPCGKQRKDFASDNYRELFERSDDYDEREDY